MGLKTRFIQLIILIHLALLVLAWPLFDTNRILYLGVELLVLLSLFYTFYLAKKFFEPLKLLTDGIQAIRDQDFQVKYMKVGQKYTDELIEVYNQMIDHLKSERLSLREQNYFLQLLIEASPTGIIVLNYDQEILTVNPAALSFLPFSLDQLEGRKLESFPNSFLQKLAKVSSNSRQTIEKDGTRKFKCHRSAFVHNGFEQSFLLLEDLSHELMATEKQAYGKVIRMMTHEVNNSMGAVNSLLETLKIFAPSGKEEQNDYLEAIQLATQRNNNLANFTRNFADVVRLPPPYFEEVDLNKVVEQVYGIMLPQCEEKGVGLTLVKAHQPVLLMMDQEQIEQVLINGVKNALE
ncbi:sensor histidine kinase [Xanthovirga aplysinae]|uniref:sensor histidine kinase n=1 Tax=Xanthovirga aplysinae TaxID=2529853 RepID=UPI0016570080|nr:PAS domain-containing protein [Xanthovirga aplysinae]